MTKTTSILESYKGQIDKIIEESIFLFGPKTKLRDACEYALTNGGKRWRPALVMMFNKAIGKNNDVTEAALAIECFHTASLIADDMPCMDNDGFRRGKPSTHKEYGETTALLASYALISMGYSLIQKNSEKMESSGRICSLAIENASHNTGFFGATGGQFLDLFPPDSSLETLQTITLQKTVSLFELSFVLGWLFGGGDEEKLPHVKEAAKHLGFAFQIVDDAMDQEQDRENECQANFLLQLGPEKALKKATHCIEIYSEILNELNIDTSELMVFIEPLKQIVEKFTVIN